MIHHVAKEIFWFFIFAIGIAILFFGMSFVAEAQSVCGDTPMFVARPDNVDPVSWGATDNVGAPSPTTVDVWWTPQAGSSINIASYPGNAIRPVSQGGTEINLLALHCSGATGQVQAKSRSAAGKESVVISKARTFRVNATPPAGPVLLDAP
jgi:hypothetical protein